MANLSKSQATELRQGARATASARGHDLQRFQRLYNGRGWIAGCKICGMDVTVLVNPAPNEIAVAGEAMALNCVWPNGVKPK
jgi:hypothetical protein